MGFRDADQAEAMLGKRTEDMTADELVSYVKHFMYAAHGLRMPISGQRERAIMLCLQKTYGRKDAGNLIKWVTWHYKGKVDGKPITYAAFSKGMRWKCDHWFLEMQQHIKKEKSKTSATPQFSSLGDL